MCMLTELCHAGEEEDWKLINIKALRTYVSEYVRTYMQSMLCPPGPLSNHTGSEHGVLLCPCGMSAAAGFLQVRLLSQCRPSRRRVSLFVSSGRPHLSSPGPTNLFSHDGVPPLSRGDLSSTFFTCHATMF